MKDLQREDFDRMMEERSAESKVAADVAPSLDLDKAVAAFEADMALLDKLNKAHSYKLASLIPEDIKLLMSQYKASHNAEIVPIEARVEELKAKIKAAVLERAATYTGNAWRIEFKKGKITWNDNKLIGFAAAHPELLAFRAEGKPSVAFCEKGKKSDAD